MTHVMSGNIYIAIYICQIQFGNSYRGVRKGSPVAVITKYSMTKMKDPT